MFSRIRKVVHWLDSESVGLVYYEFHDNGKNRFFRILLILLPNLLQSIPHSFVYDFSVKEPLMGG